MATWHKVTRTDEIVPNPTALRGYLVQLACGHCYKQVPHMMPPPVGEMRHCWQCEDEERGLAEYPRGDVAYEERMAEELKEFPDEFLYRGHTR